MGHAVSEVIWLRSLLTSLQVECKSPTTLHCDNQTAIHLAANPIYHERTKHIEVDCHFIKSHIQEGTIATSYIPTKKQPSDIFTKALGGKTFQELTVKLGTHCLHTPT